MSSATSPGTESHSMSTEHRTRLAVTAGTFVVQGAAFAATVVRLPELRDAFDLDYATLGQVLLAPALGGVLAAPLAGRLASRVGGARATASAALAWALAGLPVAHTAPSVPLLAACLAMWGAAFVSTDVGANATATALERDTGRSLLSRMHGGFSAGALVGALGGGLAAQAAFPLGRQFVAVAMLLASASVLIAVTAAPHTARPATRGLLAVAAARWPLVGLALCALMVEGAISDWAAVHLADLGASPLFAASGFVVFSITMLCGRLAGDTIIERIGRVSTIRAGAAFAVVAGGSGFAAAALTRSVPVALVAIALLGIGLAPVLPAVIAHAAATADDGRPELHAAAAASGGYIGVLLGPPIIGQVAQTVTLPWALLTLPGLLVVVLVLLTVSTTTHLRRPRLRAVHPRIFAALVAAPAGAAAAAALTASLDPPRLLLGAAVAVQAALTVPYVVALARGRAGTSWVTWIVRVATGLTSLAALVASEAQTAAIVLQVVSVSQPIAVVAAIAVAARAGHSAVVAPGRLRVATDWGCLAAAGGGWAVWWLTSDPVLAVLLLALTGLVAFVPSMPRAWAGLDRPDPYVGGALAATATLLVLTSWRPQDWIYAAYLLVVCTTTLALIRVGAASRSRTNGPAMADPPGRRIPGAPTPGSLAPGPRTPDPCTPSPRTPDPRIPGPRRPGLDPPHRS
ncbi:MAG: MFS transporter, partial [Phycicoccus sp.]